MKTPWEWLKREFRSGVQRHDAARLAYAQAVAEARLRALDRALTRAKAFDDKD